MNTDRDSNPDQQLDGLMIGNANKPKTTLNFGIIL
jgi:hypothetical protein